MIVILGMGNTWVIPVLASILFLSVFAATAPAFADEDDDDDDDDDNNSGKKNKVLTGDGPPPDKLGKIGDIYIDNESDDFDIYEKTGKKTWKQTGNLRGDTGATGPQGDDGPAGPHVIGPRPEERPLQCAPNGEIGE